jgi:hypothetical protein
MEFLRPADASDVVEAWILAEVDSSRFGPRLGELMAGHGRDRSALEDPEYRLKLLTEFRPGGGPADSDQIWVDGLPLSSLEWWYATVTREELADVLYIDWDFWLEVTDGSRLPRDYVRRLSSADVPPALRDIIAAIRDRHPLPPMILVDSGPGTRTVVVEGHLRLTAYVMAGATAPDQVEVLFGRSPLVADWSDY